MVEWFVPGKTVVRVFRSLHGDVQELLWRIHRSAVLHHAE